MSEPSNLIEQFAALANPAPPEQFAALAQRAFAAGTSIRWLGAGASARFEVYEPDTQRTSSYPARTAAAGESAWRAASGRVEAILVRLAGARKP